MRLRKYDIVIIGTKDESKCYRMRVPICGIITIEKVETAHAEQPAWAFLI